MLESEVQTKIVTTSFKATQPQKLAVSNDLPERE